MSLYFGITAYCGVIVLDDRPILIRRDQYPNGIVSGVTTGIISPEQAEMLKSKRLDMGVSDNPDRPSIYVVPIPWDSKLHSEWVDLTGNSRYSRPGQPPHYEGAAVYARIYGWDKIPQATWPHIARECFQMHAWVTGVDGRQKEILGSGHLGSYEGKNMRAVLEHGHKHFPRRTD